MIMKRLEENNFRFKYENVKYENAGHTVMSQKYRSMANFPFSLLSVTEDKGTMKIGDKVYEFEYGGTPDGNLAGQVDSRKRIMEFLNTK